MTIRKGQYRKRRTTTLNNIPKYIQKWFSGELRFTFHAYTYPYAAHLAEYWQAWKAEHPEAVKPEGLDSLMRTSYPRVIVDREKKPVI